MSKYWTRLYRTEFEPAVQARGRFYFQAHRVLLQYLEGNVAKFKVVGTNPYKVELEQQLPEKTLKWSCTCPYAEAGSKCKHIWASLLFTDEKDLFEASTPVELNENASWRADLANAERRLRAQVKFQEVGTAQATHQPRYSAAYALDLPRSVELKRVHLQILCQDQNLRPGLGVLRLAELSLDSIPQFPEEADQEILSELLGKTELYGAFDSFGKEKRFSTVVLSGDHAKSVLKRIARANKLFKLSTKNIVPGAPPPPRGARVETEPYAYREEFWAFHLDLKKIDQNYYLIPSLRNGIESKHLRDCEMTITDFIFFDTFMAESDLAKHPLWIEFFNRKREVEIIAEEVDDFLEYYFRQNTMPILLLPDNLKFIDLTFEQPEVTIALTNLKNANLGMNLEFWYGKKKVAIGNRNPFIYNIEHKQKIRRNLDYESQVIAEIEALGATRPQRAFAENYDYVMKENQFVKATEFFLTKTWQVLVSDKPVTLGKIEHIEVQSSGMDWFDLQVQFQFGAEVFTLPQLLGQIRDGERVIQLGDGSTGVLPEEWLRRFRPLIEMGQMNEEKLRINKVQALFLTAQLEGHEKFTADQRFRTLGELLKDLQNLKEQETSEKFVGSLRPYQKKGLAWLDLLSSQAIGGVLADDMGLGKTIQILALLVAHKEGVTGKAKRPTLIVAPRSLIFNWIKEAEKFAPHLTTLDYTGQKRQENFSKLAKFDILLTTYQTLRGDVDKLHGIEFDFFILDEAHYIKNAASQSSQACRMIQARKKLALTGTPIENSLGDLFSILEVVNPGLITREIRERFSREREAPALQDLGRALRPFLLRRTKDEVLKDLPAKSEQILYCELSPAERTKYDELKAHYWSQLTGTIETKSLAKSKIEILEALLRLRQAACHQGLLNPALTGQSSSKFDLLLDQIATVIQDGHKALIFSQFTSLLGLLKAQLEERGIRYEYLDGQTKDRQERVERFQSSPDIPLFLLSLKAGGVGLNLTSAGYVFILDPWWNPAAEAQAIDRAHRIGQTQKVFAYKIIAKDTVEEKILELQRTKKDLANAIVEGGGGAEQSLLKGLKMEDLKLLLG